jgi:hypothetical protein
MKKSQKPTLRVVGSTPVNAFEPPANLGKSGASKWQSIMADFVIEDRAGLELLTQLCGAIDDLDVTSATIARDGLMVRSRNGVVKEHPLLRHQIALRSFICRTIQRLGLDVEPVKSVGRPPMKVGVGPHDDYEDDD